MSKENIVCDWNNPAGTSALNAEEQRCVEGGMRFRTTGTQQSAAAGILVYDEQQKICYELY